MPGQQSGGLQVIYYPHNKIDSEVRRLEEWNAKDSQIVRENWIIVFVTDTDLQVTYLPTVLSDGPDSILNSVYFFRNDYQVPGRADNPRFYEVTLQHKIEPDKRKIYSCAVRCTEFNTAEDALKVINNISFVKRIPFLPRLYFPGMPMPQREHQRHDNWRVQVDSLHEITLEQHHYRKWSNMQQHA